MKNKVSPLHTIIFLAISAIIFGLIQFAVPYLIGFDGYFHIKYSYLLGQKGFISQLPWLQFTIHKESFRDHHLLFHYLLIPFTFGNLMFFGKIAAFLFCLILGFTIYIIFNISGVRFPIFWSIATILSSQPFLYRLSLLRVQSLSLVFLILLFYFFNKKKLWAIYFLSIIFVWYYDAFSLVLIIAGIFVLSEWLINKKLQINLFASAFLGVFTGLILSPYFLSENIGSIYYNFIRSFLNFNDIQLGTEWSPYDTWSFFKNSLPAFIIFFVTIIFIPLREKKINVEEFAALLLQLIFFLLSLKSRRFVEYWPAFAFLSAALIVGRQLPAKYLLIGFLMVSPALFLNFKNTFLEIRKSTNPSIYESSSKWLKEHSSASDIVFNADWDDFPFLFFYNHKNYYILGLDPMYMYSYDSKKYRFYQKITKGNIENPAKIINQNFNAKFIFLDKEHSSFYKQLINDLYAKKVYENKGCYIFKIIQSVKNDE